MNIYIAIFLGGLAALTWEVLWLHYAALAVGISAQAAAIVLSAMMLGMALGSLTAGAVLERHSWGKATWLLALFEGLIGIAGFFVSTGFHIVEQWDTWAFHGAPDLAPWVQSAGIIFVIGIPAFFMGATTPLYARIADHFKLSIGSLYATNVAGASIGILVASFLWIPNLGIKVTILSTVYLNLMAALFALTAKPLTTTTTDKKNVFGVNSDTETHSMARSAIIVFCTGLATFVLEVVWFRALRAAMHSTTESFALMLFATLIALACGGYLSARLRRSKRISLSFLMALAGFLIFVATPVIERFDLFVPLTGSYEMFMFKRLVYVLVLLGPPMAALGMGLPWLLDIHHKTGKVGVLYAVNTFGAIVGAIGAAWFLLPVFGSAKGAWVAGIVLLIAAAVAAGGKELKLHNEHPIYKIKGVWGILVLGLLGLLIAGLNESGIGDLRVQGASFLKKYTVLDSREGPEATVSVIEDDRKARHLIIDGFFASGENEGTHYMEWMGRLPMILHDHPRNALVICFGTGQTANGVRLEEPEHLDIVDVNPEVFEMAPLFTKNQRVLEDPRVRKIVMDGRAFLRRTTRTFDVITLEPMPPTFAGSNALYSLEFYQSIKLRLNDNGVAAQWLPFHLVDPAQSASIVATFIEVFSDTVLWIDHLSQHGILLGFKRESRESMPLEWYGFKRGRNSRDLSDQDISQSLIFREAVLKEFARSGMIITDDNQFLSYGYGRMKWFGWGPYVNRQKYSLDILNNIASQLKND